MKTKLYSVHAPAILNQVDATFVAYLDSEKNADTVYIGMTTTEDMPDCPLVMYKKETFTEQNLHNYVRIFMDTSIDLVTAIKKHLRKNV